MLVNGAPGTSAYLTARAAFRGAVIQEGKSHRWDVPNTIAADCTATATALGTDATRKDTTLQATATLALRPGVGLQPSVGYGGVAPHSKFLNDLLILVNNGKATALLPADMGAEITAAVANILPPVNTAAPVASGTGTVGQTLTTTNGTWSFNPTSFQYRWLRAGFPIPGATASTYLLVAADSGKTVSCRVSATNQAGTGTMDSNGIAVA